MYYLGIQRPIHPTILYVAKTVRQEILHLYKETKGTCGEASQEIVEKLQTLGIKATSEIADFCVYTKGVSPSSCWDGHVVVRVNRCILDVTADQFNDDLRQYKQPIRMRSIVYGSWEELLKRYLRFDRTSRNTYKREVWWKQ